MSEVDRFVSMCRDAVTGDGAWLSSCTAEFEDQHKVEDRVLGDGSTIPAIVPRCLRVFAEGLRPNSECRNPFAEVRWAEDSSLEIMISTPCFYYYESSSGASTAEEVISRLSLLSCD